MPAASKTPWVPRVAVCLCGMLRDHFLRVYSSMNATLFHLPGLAVDTYIETWDEPKCLRSVPRSTWDEAYPNLTSLAVEPQTADAGRHLHNLSLPQSLLKYAAAEGALKLKHTLSGLPHAWAMQRCSNSIKRKELADAFRYDAIVKVRGDSRFWHATRGVPQSLPYLTAMLGRGQSPHYNLYHFLGGADARHQLSDKYAVGTSAAMHYYLSSAPRLLRHRTIIELLTASVLDASFPSKLSLHEPHRVQRGTTTSGPCWRTASAMRASSNKGLLLGR